MILFLKKVPLQTLKKAGISTLIQEAIFPILPFLSLNTESESVKLLSPAYEALLILAQLDTDTQRRRLLDRLIRAGILKGYYNAPYQVRVVELLMHKTTAIIKILGISSSRHLQVTTHHMARKADTDLLIFTFFYFYNRVFSAYFPPS